MADQGMVATTGDKWSVSFGDSIAAVGTGALVECVPFGNQIIPVKQLVLSLDIESKRIPNRKEMEKYVVPPNVVYSPRLVRYNSRHFPQPKVKLPIGAEMTQYIRNVCARNSMTIDDKAPVLQVAKV